MDWFERLTGFPEGDYLTTQEKLCVDGQNLRSLVNGKTYGVGLLTVPSVLSLRRELSAVKMARGKLKLSALTGDIRAMHGLRENSGATFQVASQFNLLEMISPSVTPEDGVACYENDLTQGPACAIAAGAATIYRNYLVPVRGELGQTANRQIDALADVGSALSKMLDVPVSRLWEMKNGYALCSQFGLDAITRQIESMTTAEVDSLRDCLRVGVHSRVEVTDNRSAQRKFVTQVFCSALPVAYTDVPSQKWAVFASLILEGAYEATLLAAVLNGASGGSNDVFLTHLGGGAFGNRKVWITNALRRALRSVANSNLHVRIVSFSHTTEATASLIEEFA